MSTRLCGTAALVPIDAVSTLRRAIVRGGDMILRSGLRSLVCGTLLSLAAISLARAEGTYEIPAGAHFNQDKLAKVGAFFRNEVATGKIPGAIIVVVLSTLASWLFHLDAHGVSVVGQIPAGLPKPTFPDIQFGDIGNLLPAAFSLTLLACILYFKLRNNDR